MVVSMSPTLVSMRSKKTQALGVPTVDFSMDRSSLSQVIVTACEEYGFFKVVNHGIAMDIISRMEEEGAGFFAKPCAEKQKAGPPNPFGYGCKNIGFHGDKGEIEYLLLQANPPRLNALSHHSSTFSLAVDDYIGAVKGLMCKVLDLVGEGLRLPDPTIFSSLIRDVDNDSCFRVNHYPPIADNHRTPSPQVQRPHRIGFGEHSDPQILTILRSNDVGGLQIITPDGLWIPVPPEPTSFYVFVGDAFEALTNGRFTSVRHRVMANLSMRPRMSMMYFGAPALNTWISPIPQLISSQNPRRYKQFTWSEYKKTAYSLRLGDQRIGLFKCHPTVN